MGKSEDGFSLKVAEKDKGYSQDDLKELQHVGMGTQSPHGLNLPKVVHLLDAAMINKEY